jgi:hypothetical protein
MTSLETSLHQRRWEITASVSPSVYFGHERPLCGIYTLEFSTDDERYVGQTINLVHRIATHLRNWDDIVAVSFIECAPDELDELERKLIAQTQRDHALRNKMFTSNPASHPELDLIIDRQEQIEWLDGVAPSYPIDKRTVEAERRLRMHKKSVELASSPHYESLLADISEYVHQVIPWPSVTGGTYWSMSPMPSTGRRKDHRRLLTINAHNVELVRTHEVQDPVEVGTALNLAPGHVKGVHRKDWEVETTRSYRSYGPCDVLWLPLGAMNDALAIPGVLSGAREMALRLMQKGPSTYARFHSDAFLDAVLMAQRS